MVFELFFAKFLEILTTELLEIGKFLQKQSSQIFLATLHALHLTGFCREYGKPIKFLGSLHPNPTGIPDLILHG